MDYAEENDGGAEDEVYEKTPYDAPELGETGPTIATDSWAVGVLTFKLLTGHHPFPAQHTVQQLFKHIDEPLPLIETLDRDVREDVNQVIQKATAKNPKQRYQDPLALAAAFRQAAALRGNDKATELVESLTLREHEKVVVETPGAGGYGPPAERDRALVDLDRVSGKFSAGWLDARYP